MRATSATATAPSMPRDDSSLRVVVVTESFLPAMNGVARSVVSVVQELQARGHEVTIIAPAPGPDRFGPTPVIRMPSLPLPWTPSFPLGLPTARLTATLRRLRPDVVHLASPVLLGARAASVCRELSLPTVAVYQTDVAGFAADHGLDSTQRLLWRWLRNVHNACSLTLAPSRAAVADLRTHGVERIARWGRGIDRVSFAPAHRTRPATDRVDRVRVGYVGRLAQEKRIDRLHLVVDLPDTEVVVVGDGDERRTLERLLPTARFTGELRGAALSRAYADLDVFVHTGVHETFCQAVQEALASGVPVVAPAAGGPLDLVRHGRTGLLWDPHRPVSLRESVARLAGDPPLRRRQGLAARRDVVDRTWSALTDELLDHYRSVLPGTARPTRTAA